MKQDFNIYLKFKETKLFYLLKFEKIVPVDTSSSLSILGYIFVQASDDFDTSITSFMLTHERCNARVF